VNVRLCQIIEMPRNALVGIMVLVVSVTFLSCAASDGDTSGLGTDASAEDSDEATAADSEAFDVLSSSMQARQESVMRSFWYRSLAEAFPSAKEPNLPGETTKAVVVGNVVDVAPGKAFTSPDNPGEDGNPESIPIDFDDPSALWRTVHLTVRVNSVVDGDRQFGGTDITVGLVVDGSLGASAALDGAMAIPGRAVFFLTEDNPVFDYDPSVLAIVGDGALLAVEDRGNSYRLPFLSDNDAANLLGNDNVEKALR